MTLVDQLRQLGLPDGAAVVVHTSFKAVGKGTPEQLIAALLEAIGPEGTLVMPSMSDDDDHPFDPARTPCRAMGIVADTFWRQPGVRRRNHYGSFAAAGPLAEIICAPHALDDPNHFDGPLGRLAALSGYVLLLGVRHSENTTLHIAENLARVPYRVPKYYTDLFGQRVDYRETDHCCQGFEQLTEWLGPLQNDGYVGRAPSRLIRSADLLRVALEHLRHDPCVFLHPRGQCTACDLAWSTVPA